MSRRVLRNVIRNTKRGLKDYCSNSSLSGLSYIVNDRLHYTERVFWTICFAVSCYFSYSFIDSYNKSFSENSISLVIETVQPLEKTKFPSVGVCEVPATNRINPKIGDILLNELSANGTLEDKNDVEKFFNGFAYPPTDRLYLGNCEQAEEDEEPTILCPKSGFRRFAEMIVSPCEELILDCKWQGKPFNCCHYFLPLYTTMGKCFMLNSIQTAKKNGNNWLNVDIRRADKLTGMEFVFRGPVSITIGNDDDVPSYLLNRLTRILTANQLNAHYAFNLMDMINDDGIKKKNYIDRKCKFPDENDSNLYKYHSFSVCTTTCIRDEQLRRCNCTFYTYTTKVEHAAHECDLDGLKCLMEKGIYAPDKGSLQPWRSYGLKCTCFPSCNENQIKIIEERKEERDSMVMNKTVTLKLQTFPKKKFRRQSVRGALEVVVTIGGILSLFLGASIISGIEFLYFLIVRILKIF